jgi:hypothetical protein
MKYIRKFNEMDTFNITFSSKEEFIKFWSDRWKGTNAEKFPKEFIETFETQFDYSEWEKENYNYGSEFDADSEIENIDSEFGIAIGDDEDCDISSDEWVDFYNSCWTWLKNNKK